MIINKCNGNEIILLLVTNENNSNTMKIWEIINSNINEMCVSIIMNNEY